MAIRITTKKSEIYTLISERDLPEIERVKFHIATASVRDQMAIRDELYRGDVMIVDGERVFGRTVNLQAAKAFELLVTDVIGLVNEEGKPIKYDLSTMARIPAEIVWEVGRHIVETMEIKGESVKN